ncbi:MAG: DUF1573 domain-containing protein [Bacteroidales bacterium]|nr:DUF1573 domain-containing protein [Bacteroidales bacterium]
MRAASLLAAAAVAVAAHAAPQVVWTAMEHDFGAFDEALGVVTCTFAGVNTGNEPLVVIAARANCGCTTPHFSDRPVAPGDTAFITVGYDAKGRPGRFSKKVVVTTNTDPAKSTLTVSGTVIGTSNTLRSRYPVDAGAMKLRTDVLAYGEVSRSSTGGQYIEAYNASADTLRPRVVSSPPYVSATISPAAVPPGENFVISTVFDPMCSQKWDLVTDTLVVEAAGRSVPISTVGIITEDFSRLTPAQHDRAPVIRLTPEVLDAGRLSRSSAPLTFTVEIANQGREEMKLRRVYCTDPAVSLTLKKSTVKPGKRQKLIVTVDPARIPASASMLNSRIIIIANDPANPRNVIRLVGELTP